LDLVARELDGGGPGNGEHNLCVRAVLGKELLLACIEQRHVAKPGAVRKLHELPSAFCGLHAGEAGGRDPHRDCEADAAAEKLTPGGRSVLGRHRWTSSLGQGHETRRPGAAELPAKGQSRRPCNKRSAVVSRSLLGHAAFGVHSYTRRSVPPKRKLPRPVDSLELDFRQRRIDEGKRRAGMTGRAIPLGRIAGIPIRLDSSWFLIFAL